MRGRKVNGGRLRGNKREVKEIERRGGGDEGRGKQRGKGGTQQVRVKEEGEMRGKLGKKVSV